MKGERHVLSADETVSVCVYVYLCVFEFVPNSILRSPPLSFSLSCFEAAFFAFPLILRQVNKLRTANSRNSFEICGKFNLFVHCKHYKFLTGFFLALRPTTAANPRNQF